VTGIPEIIRFGGVLSGMANRVEPSYNTLLEESYILLEASDSGFLRASSN
jgi:hypothetical protein